MALAGSGAADEHGVALPGYEGAGGERALAERWRDPIILEAPKPSAPARAAAA